MLRKLSVNINFRRITPLITNNYLISVYSRRIKCLVWYVMYINSQQWGKLFVAKFFFFCNHTSRYRLFCNTVFNQLKKLRSFSPYYYEKIFSFIVFTFHIFPFCSTLHQFSFVYFSRVFSRNLLILYCNCCSLFSTSSFWCCKWYIVYSLESCPKFNQG